MKTIRHSVFETNSSSCHSVTFSDVITNTSPMPSEVRFFAEGLYCSEGALAHFEKKADYLSVCMGEYMRLLVFAYTTRYYKERYTDEAWTEFMSDKKWSLHELYDSVPGYDEAILFIHQWLKIPQEALDFAKEWFDGAKSAITEYFRERGVDAVFDDYYDENRGIRIHDGYIHFDGGIDHESSAEYANTPGMDLATMWSRDMPAFFDLIFNPNSIIHCDYCG